MRAGRTQLLDAVRGLAVVAVVAYHCFTHPVLRHGLRFLGLDEAGVPVLAVVAGLVVLVTASGALAVLSYRLVERPFLDRKARSGDRSVPTEKALAGQAA